MTGMVSGIQGLPLEILLSIFDQLGSWSCLGILSETCRVFRKAVNTYVQYHPEIQLTNDPNEARIDDKMLIADFLELLCLNKTLTLGIRKINASIHAAVHIPYDPLSREARRQLAAAVPLFPHTLPLPGRTLAQVQYEQLLLYVLLMCRNTESISIVTNCELRWSQIGQALQQQHWPGDRLKEFHVTFPAFRRGEELHDIQDLWLFLSAPSLSKFEARAIQQGNNLYNGSVDRAAIRTIYWPLELEIPSLYHHTYLGQCDHSLGPSQRPTKLPAPRTGSMVTQGFKQLQKLVLQDLDWPQTWFAIMLPCLEKLKHLQVSIRLIRPYRDLLFPAYLPDLRLLDMGVEKLHQTLHTLVLDVQKCHGDRHWTNDTNGYYSIESFQNLGALRYARLPWYALPSANRNRGVQSDASSKDCLTPYRMFLPSKLERLVLTRCDLANPGTIKDVVSAATASVQRAKLTGALSSLKTINLQAEPESNLAQADFREHNGQPIRIVVEEGIHSGRGYVAYSDPSLL